MSLVKSVIVDDFSSQIAYSNSPSWTAATSSSPAVVIKWTSNSRGSCYGDTFHEATSTAPSLTFKFTGTAVTVVGVVPNKRASNRIEFTIDGGSPSYYIRDVPVDTSSFSSAEDFDFGVTLFSTSGLSASEHTLTLKGLLQGPLFALDYIEYIEAAAASSSSNTETTSSGTTSGSSTQTTSGTTTGTTSATDATGSSGGHGPSFTDSRSSPMGTGVSVGNSDSSSSPGNQVSVPAAVGGAIGGVAGIVLIIFGVYLCLRRQNSIEENNKVTYDRLEAANGANATAERDAPIPLRNLSEKQRLALEMQNQSQDRQETTSPFIIPLTKPAFAAMAPSTSSLSHENHSHSLHQTPPSGNAVPPHSPPPSFRTRPLSRHLDMWDAPALPHAHSSISSGEPHLPPPGAATEVTESEPGLPPYAEDVLARPDARNLSEADVDVIARRLAEVMQAQRQARGGPGLLREHEPPPRELIDQLVEEHLGAREGIS